MKKEFVTAITIVLIILAMTGVLGLIDWQMKHKQPIELTVQVPLNPTTLISQGYLVKTVDPYGRETWRIGTQVVKPTEEFCILSEPGTDEFFDDIFSRYPISILRTDQLYNIYSCEFRQSSSSREGSWVEKVWGIEAVK